MKAIFVKKYNTIFFASQEEKPGKDNFFVIFSEKTEFFTRFYTVTENFCIFLKQWNMPPGHSTH